MRAEGSSGLRAHPSRWGRGKAVAASTTLASRSALKLYLGIDAADTGSDDLLDGLLAYASERIESHCRRRFAEEALTEYLDGRGSAELVLSRRPVSSLDEVCIDPDREFGPETALEASDTELNPTLVPILEPGFDFGSSLCGRCLYCVQVCPEEAIQVEGELGYLEAHLERYGEKMRSL